MGSGARGRPATLRVCWCPVDSSQPRELCCLVPREDATHVPGHRDARGDGQPPAELQCPKGKDGPHPPPALTAGTARPPSPIFHLPVARRSGSNAGARCNGCMAAAAALPRRLFTGSGAAPQPAGLCPSPPPRPPAARPRAASRRPAPPPPAAPRAGEGSEAAAGAARSRCSAPQFAPAEPPPPPAAERGPSRPTTQRAPAARLRARAEGDLPPRGGKAGEGGSAAATGESRTEDPVPSVTGLQTRRDSELKDPESHQSLSAGQQARVSKPSLTAITRSLFLWFQNNFLSPRSSRRAGNTKITHLTLRVRRKQRCHGLTKCLHTCRVCCLLGLEGLQVVLHLLLSSAHRAEVCCCPSPIS